MSRHGRKVPTSFYHRFTKDACALADEFAEGRIISVLEGGYSDLALIGGTMAHVCALVTGSDERTRVDRDWWSIDNLMKVRKAISTSR
jgi:histone deacetylase HOS3